MNCRTNVRTFRRHTIVWALTDPETRMRQSLLNNHALQQDMRFGLHRPSDRQVMFIHEVAVALGVYFVASSLLWHSHYHWGLKYWRPAVITKDYICTVLLWCKSLLRFYSNLRFCVAFKKDHCCGDLNSQGWQIKIHLSDHLVFKRKVYHVNP